MKIGFKTGVAAGFAALTMLASTAAHAVSFVGFASFSQQTGTKSTLYTENSGTLANPSTFASSSAIPVSINFFGFGAFNANLSFNFKSANAASASGGNFSQSGFQTNGAPPAFQFVYTGPNTTLNSLALNTGAVLFSGTVSGATLSASAPTTGSFQADSVSGVVSFSSPYFNFGNTTGRSLSFSLDSLTRPLVQTVSSNGSQTSSGTVGGQFSIAVVPEPGAWALMIMGMGMLGFALRRRQVAFA